MTPPRWEKLRDYDPIVGGIHSPTVNSEHPMPPFPRKQTAGDLAILGGPPAFIETQLVGRPNLPAFETFTEYMREVFDRRWLTNRGPLLQQFEDQVGDVSGVKHCIAVANATLGLQLVVHAAGLTQEVIVPSFLFHRHGSSLSLAERDACFCGCTDVHTPNRSGPCQFVDRAPDTSFGRSPSLGRNV